MSSPAKKNKKNILKSISAGIFVAVVVGALSYFFSISGGIQSKGEATVSNNLFGWEFPVTKFPLTGPGSRLAYSDIRDPGGIPEGLPVRLKIPIIGVNSAIEDALITPDGRMDVPAGSKNVAWFSLGPNPGEIGSAVIGGHFGINDGVKFVFFDLDKLRVGDRVYIEDDKGDTLTFVVRNIELFDRDDDATTVFTSNDNLAHLNLITCEGIWNQVDDSYPERRVVFTDFLLGETVNTIPEQSIIIKVASDFPRNLSLSDSGKDVVALQTILEQKGLLTIPPGVEKGFFGGLTRAAVAKYQAVNGISPPLGYFGPLTKARLLSEIIVEGGKPLLPRAAITTSDITKPLVSFEVFLKSIKSLFATPTDWSITLFLLISIIFVGLKIKRR